MNTIIRKRDVNLNTNDKFIDIFPLKFFETEQMQGVCANRAVSSILNG